MNVPDDLRYNESHEWVRIDGDTVTIGITDHAQAELTDIVYVELPKSGVNIKSGDALCVVESVKAASDIYSPLSGEVVEANSELETEPALLNTDPYNRGWIFKLKLSDVSELDTLKTPEAYRDQLGGS